MASSERASGAERWLTLEPSRRCTPDREVLASRITGALAGTRAPELVVHVELVDAARGTTARVRLSRSTRELGTKRIEANGCEEAIDAVVAIAALALGTLATFDSPPQQSPPLPTPSRAPGARSDAAPRALPAASERKNPERSALERRSQRETASEEKDRGVSESQPSARIERWRWLWSAGVSRGALAATPIVGAGVSVELGRSELRGALEYGLPSSDEVVDASLGLERSRSDFAAATFDACHALDSERWLSVCAAIEARVTRWSQIEAPAGEQSVERAELDPAALAGGGVSFAYAAANWRPRLDVSALLPIAAKPWNDGGIGIRAALGASLPF